MYKILVVDDDAQMLELIGQLLEREGYHVMTATSARDVMQQLRTQLPDLFIIDVVLRDMDGLTLCRQLRRDPQTRNQPIVFIAGAASTYTVADALAAGGDDYIEKPFAVRELIARLRAHLRRVIAQTTNTDLPILQIVQGARMALVDGREIDLTQVEFELLSYLCQQPDKLHSTQDLLGNVWNYPPDTGDAALVRNHIRNLRRKLEIAPDRPEIIQSRHGRGYTVKAAIEFCEEVPFRIRR